MTDFEYLPEPFNTGCFLRKRGPLWLAASIGFVLESVTR
jgi:hypothetical protein